MGRSRNSLPLTDRCKQEGHRMPYSIVAIGILIEPDAVMIAERAS